MHVDAVIAGNGGGGSATVKIELPRNWDQLMEELGYEPLKSFFS